MEPDQQHVLEPDELGDTPDLDELYERPPDDAVRVDVASMPSVNQVPRELGVARTLVLPTGAGPRRLVGYDPRRARVQIIVFPPASATVDGLMVAGSPAEVELFRGFFIAATSTAQVRHEFDIRSELWVRPVDLAAGGVFAASTSALVVSYETELWSR